MAKGNMLLGYSRGSVGSMVFSRVKGQQITKARNSKPANPKSNKQMKQRSSFISPVKFYTHGVQALFKFAFSDKKVTESDFNAFMRNNSKAAFPVTKAENDNPSFPALGNYMMTKGKLAEIVPARVSAYPPVYGLNLGATGDISSIADVSKAFINMGYAEEGDIVTFVVIEEAVAYFDLITLDLIPGNVPSWHVVQFVVDSSDSRDFIETVGFVSFEEINNNAYIYFGHYDQVGSEFLQSVAIIRSRETALGLEVSTSYLHNGGDIDEYIRFRNTKAQVDKVLADWGATGDAILQGAIAKK